MKEIIDEYPTRTPDSLKHNWSYGGVDELGCLSIAVYSSRHRHNKLVKKESLRCGAGVVRSRNSQAPTPSTTACLVSTVSPASLVKWLSNGY
jgi:hypothetical protein